MLLSAALNLDVLIGDLSCGFMHAEPSEKLYLKPPDDAWHFDPEIGPDTVWKATKAINGGRSSLKDFNNFVGGKLRERGYEPLQTDSQMFYNKVTGVVFHVHVDDPWAVGKATELYKIFEDLSRVMMLKFGEVVKIGQKFVHLGEEYERTHTG